jgi:FKBP-type peptidyl-prolyl cis-trans isomerase SlyD
MKIENNKVVSISYDLQTTDEAGTKKSIEKVGKEHPMVFLFGSSGLPEKFEENLLGLNPGDNFDFVVESEEAYGDLEKDAVVTIPLETFSNEGKFDEKNFPVGKILPMSDQDGHIMHGKIIAVSPQGIKMDFNHPLAGMDLYFKGEVVEVRDATADEISHGHAHGPGGHHH